jgi:hypothetical protein
MKQFVTAALAALLPVMAGATSPAEGRIAALQAEGYDRIEVRTGPSQTRIEALRCGEKVELVIDSVTGTVLKHEIESATGDPLRAGVRYRVRDGDFVGERHRRDDDDD